MTRTGGVDPRSAQALQKTASATEQLVKLNKETSKQTRWMIALTIIITFLTLVNVIAVIIQISIK